MLAIKIDTIENYKRVCDKLHNMGYTRQSKNKFNEYYFADQFETGDRTMYLEGKGFWRTRSDMGGVPAKKFLGQYDL